MKGDQESIVVAAQSMVDRYGNRALAEVDQRIDELRRHGEEEVAQLWLNIRSHVVFFLDTNSDGQRRH